MFSGYAIFVGEKSTEMLRQQPSLSNLALQAHLCEQYTLLPEELKAKYERNAAALNVASGGENVASMPGMPGTQSFPPSPVPTGADIEMQTDMRQFSTQLLASCKETLISISDDVKNGVLRDSAAIYSLLEKQLKDAVGEELKTKLEEAKQELSVNHSVMMQQASEWKNEVASVASEKINEALAELQTVRSLDDEKLSAFKQQLYGEIGQYMNQQFEEMTRKLQAELSRRF